MIEKKWTVYSLADSRSPEDVRYIGITSNPRRRLRDHKRTVLDTHKGQWVRSVLDAGADVVMAIVANGLTEAEAKKREISLIAEYRSKGSRLTNATQGGDGVVGKTPEVRAKISEKSKARITPEVVARLQKALRRPEVVERKRAAIKEAMTPDVRRRIGDAHRGKVVSRETRAKLALANIGKVHGEESRGKMSLAQRTMAVRQDNSSGFRGVSFDKRRERWEAYLTVNGKRQHLGRFETAEEAAVARDAAAIKSFGAGCFLNLPAAANDNAKHEGVAA